MASIRKEITKGIFWIAVAKYSGIAIQLAVTAVLARLITPATFGTVAISMVILNFLNIWTDIGMGPAVVQYKDLTKRHLDSLFTLNIYIGVVLATVLFMSVELISTYYNDKELVNVCRVMAIVLFFNSLNVIPNALMRKDQRFKDIALRTLSIQLLSGCIAIIGAANGWGVYALLVSPILTSIGVFAINFYNYPLRYVLTIDKEAFNKIASYSLFQFVFSIFNYFSWNFDKLIVGRAFSTTQLGYYEKSYQLMQVPISKIAFVIEPVLHPMLSTFQDNKKELCAKNQKLVQSMAYISFPIALLLHFCASEIIMILYGNQWEAAVPVFRILALSIPLLMIVSTSGAIYQAAGKTKHLFFNGIIITALTVSGYLIATFYGKTIESVAWALTITTPIYFCASYWIMYKFTFGEPTIMIYKALLPQIINSTIVFIIMMFACNIFIDTHLIISLIGKAILITTLTIVLAALLRQYKLNDIITIILKRIKK